MKDIFENFAFITFITFLWLLIDGKILAAVTAWILGRLK